MSEATHTGGCQCGAVRYRVEVDATSAMTCNCSMCGRAGTVLAFAPWSKFELLSGQDALTDYQFGKKRLHHLFCKVCGIKSFSRGVGRDGVEMAAINLRCIDGIEVDKIQTRFFDGKSLPLD